MNPSLNPCNATDCATILTTCGFGSYYPETVAGRIFTVVYTLIML